MNSINWVQILSTLLALEYYIHHAHWIVNGDDAYMYHLLYDRVYGSLGDLVDQYAEYLVWQGEWLMIPGLLVGVESQSVARINTSSDDSEENLREKILNGMQVLKDISQSDGRDRTENRILDDISSVTSTALYLLQQTYEEQEEINEETAENSEIWWAVLPM